jgi:hypothetical protein
MNENKLLKLISLIPEVLYTFFIKDDNCGVFFCLRLPEIFIPEFKVNYIGNYFNKNKDFD